MKWVLGGRMQEKDDGGKLTQYLAVLSATVVLFTSGLYQGWPAPSLTKIFSDEYPFEVNEEEGSYITIIGPMGHVIGGFIWSYLLDKIGRKKALLTISIPQILSFGLIFFSSYGKYLLYIARVLGGMGEGASFTVVPGYIAEVAEPEVRGILGSFICSSISIGLLVINLVGSFMDIHATALVCLAFPIFFLLIFSIMPETPYFHLMNKDVEKARESLQILRRQHNVEKELKQLTADVERQMSERGTFKDLFFIDSNRRALIMVVCMRFFGLFSGAVAFASYNQILIAQSTNIDPTLGSTIILIILIATVFLSCFYIDRIRRKTLFTVSSAFVSLSLFSQAIFLTIRDYTSVDVSSCSWLPLLIMIIFNFAFMAGIGVGANIFIGEIYSTSIKSKAMFIGSVVFSTCVISTTKFYQYTADNLGLAVPFYCFGIITFFGTLFYHFVMVETQGKSLETIQRELKGMKDTPKSTA
ncbi:facilitated trehalose transporter Tret1-like [Cylas formicarius]|uniref:facilitated trehalose transporter Tret1-like n=1 Tax=Cylas formicarius TaxID=197179 RepID=UPI002958C89F|nr:facilitated trehalose transporter Tret1-like [Cylas formicarius]